MTAGAAIALPGLVDSGGRLLVAPNLGWTGVAVGGELSERIGAPPFPLQAENEANLGALAELWEGAGRGSATSSTSPASSASAPGIIVGGELFRGAHGFGGELGHITVDREGEVCACGSRGCLETRVALGAMLHAAGPQPTERVTTLAERAEAGDAQVVATLTRPGAGSGWRRVGREPAQPARHRHRRLLRDARAVARARALEPELATRVLSAEWDAPGVVNPRWAPRPPCAARRRWRCAGSSPTRGWSRSCAERQRTPSRTSTRS